MSVFHENMLVGASGQGGAGGSYQISRSLRFNSVDSAYLSRTPGVAGNQRTFTWAGWTKRCKLGGNTFVLFGGQNGNFFIRYSDDNGGDILRVYSGSVDLQTTAKFRDTAAWNHVVVAVDTTQVTAANRVQLYVNGVLITAFTLANYPLQNATLNVNDTSVHTIGALPGPTQFFDGYLADIHFIDGQALTPASFGEFDANGEWQPKAYTGTYGTNGFKLNFADNSAATAEALGKDTSGNGNKWTPNNFFVASSAFGGTTNVSTIASTSWVAGGTTLEMVDGSDASYYNAFSGGIQFTTNVSGYFKTKQGRGAGGLCWHEYYDASNNLIYSSTPVNVAVGATAIIGPYYVANVRKVIAKSNATGNGSDGHGIHAFYINDYLVNTNSNSATSFSFGPYTTPANDSLADTPTSYGIDTGVGGEVVGNYATLNPLDTSIATLSNIQNGALEIVPAADYVGIVQGASGTIGVTSGKWYFEGNPFAQAGSGNQSSFGWSQSTSPTDGTFYGNTKANAIGVLCDNYGNAHKFVATLASASLPTGTILGGAVSGDIFQIAVDFDAGRIWIGRNGTWYNSGNPAAGTNATSTFTNSGATWRPWVENAAYNGNWNRTLVNFGQRPFAYAAPSGFKVLCDINLPAPAIAKPSTAMGVVTYTGTGASRSVAGLGFSPDLVWIKGRSYVSNHALYDTVRGVTLELSSNSTSAETVVTQGLTAFNSSGFTIGTSAQLNVSSSTYVAWCWDAGSSTVTNTAGTISSQVRANPSAGFSVVTYTGTGANATVGHGLGVAPQFLIIKQRNGTNNWWVYHQALGSTQYLNLETTSAAATASTVWNNTSPTSTVFSIGSATSNGNTLAYCFAPVAGYSAFGSYTGNNNANGPFVYTGFRPRWVMIKGSSVAGGHWMLFDTTRSTYNVTDNQLYANLSNGEISANSALDILSNGFRCKADTFSNINGSGVTYIYAAFAESPFQYSRAR